MAAPEPPAPFRLLDLPPEIRHIIYDFVMPLDKETMIVYPDWGSPWNLNPGLKTIRSLIKVNRQIYTEASSLLYGQLEFVFGRLCCFKLWMSNLREAKHRVKEVSFAGQGLVQIRSVLHELKSISTTLRTVTFLVRRPF